MGQRASTPSQPQAGTADRQTRRQFTIWRRSPVDSSEPDGSATERILQRRTFGRRAASSNRLSQFMQSSNTDPEQQQQSPTLTTQSQRTRSTSFFDGRSIFPSRQRTTSSNSLWPGRRSPITSSSPGITPEVVEDDSVEAESMSSRRSVSDRFAGRRTGRSSSSIISTGGTRRRDGSAQSEDHNGLLSQLLSAAASATATQLLDGDEEAISRARGTATDDDDGSFDGFLRSIESGRLANEANAPLNFFRMFRFGTPATAAPGRNGSTTTATATTITTSSNSQPASTANGSSGRMVPIIIVGIRAVPPGAEMPEVPFLGPLSGANNRPSTTRRSHRRRASMGGVNRFPASYDNQRDHRSPDRTRRESITSDDRANWPRPPPVSPASPNLPTMTSRIPTPVASRRRSIIRTTTTTTTTTTTEDVTPFNERRVSATRQRRLSDSDHHRHSTRRNGIVEPDAPVGENSRSWVIYVLGGSYPEGHPLLTTPSLFTDSPTYEDMMLLSQLLGPAKPPVATEQDIEEAGGCFRIEMSADAGKTAQLVAVAVEGNTRVELAHQERCLVCLSDFGEGEDARRLNKCDHLFHRECIDQWLMKGRNSCPLCRAEGVHETKKMPQPVDSAAPTPEIPSSNIIPGI